MEEEILAEFISESREGLDRLDADFITLEVSPDDADTLASVFRTIHTIKGTCGFFGYATLERLAHVGENLLVQLRDGDIALTEAMTSTLLEMVDGVRALLDGIEANGRDEGDYSDLISRLEQHRNECGDADLRAPSAEVQEVVQADEPEHADESEAAVESDAEANAPETTPENVVVFDTSEDEQAMFEPQPLDPEMQQVLIEFIGESTEGLDRVSAELMELEVTPGDLSTISSIFRTIHTIKGTCGFFGFANLERLTHAGENLLVTMRDDGLAMNEDIADSLLSMVDVVNTMLQQIESAGHDGNDRHQPLIDQMVALRESAAGGDNATSDSSAPASGDVVDAAKSDTTVSSSVSDTSVEPGRDTVSAASADAKLAAVAQAAAPAAAVVKEQPSSGAAGKEAAKAAKPPAASITETSVRVDVPLLDSLMTQVGELVLARNQIVEHVNRYEDPMFIAAAQRLNQITSELQEGVMQTRMQPIHSIWAKLPRVVRDLSKSVGKKIRVEMEGKETELDKSLIEAMKDPLTHLVRNSVDHGIEDSETRLANGKPAEGVLLLRAYHEGGQVHIEICDDGAGIDPGRLRDKAISRELLSEEQAAQMSDADLCKLVFLPGLSTAEKVTNISGRGVGMDVVKTNIDAISGTIDLESNAGVGTTFKIRVPLTLAIVPALIVTSGGEQFAFPQANLLELIRVETLEDRSVIEEVQGCPVYRLRGKLLPIVYFNDELCLPTSERSSLNIVVLQAEQTRFGVVVDEINESQEIVVKPLANAIRSVPVFAGATIMGDGHLALIVDVPGLARRAGMLNEQRRHQIEQAHQGDEEHARERRSLLLVKSPAGERVAIPLSDVARLEQFNDERIESAGHEDVVQYRGQIMPLVSLANVLVSGVSYGGSVDAGQDNARRVVVFGEEGNQVGLVVSEILDVVDDSLEITASAARHGVTGSAVIQERVTELFDVHAFLQSTNRAETIHHGEH